MISTFESCVDTQLFKISGGTMVPLRFFCEEEIDVKINIALVHLNVCIWNNKKFLIFKKEHFV